MKWSGHLEVSYCTNVHAGEGLGALLSILKGAVSEVKAKQSPTLPFGGGIRIGAETASRLRQASALKELNTALQSLGMYVFSVNGFPYGDFAAERVKETVYEPDWEEDARLEYTLTLAQALSQLNGPQKRTISTVAGGFQPTALTLNRRSQFMTQFKRLAEGLAIIEAETGICVRVALEPEPWTTLERVDQVIPFFEEVVWPCSPLAHRYLGLCYDTCHQALAFEDPLDSWRALVQAEIPILKVQISNALRLTKPKDPAARAQLLSFDEPRYLHQVTALTPEGQVLRSLDLDELKNPSQAWLEAEEWRCHFHVPIWWAGTVDDTLSTTRFFWEEIARLIANPAAQPHTSNEEPLHVEVETYSWSVIPEKLRGEASLVDDVCRELDTLRWVMGVEPSSL